jgi:hypothetical protein
MHSSAYMILIKAELLITKNSPLLLPVAALSVEDPPQRLVAQGIQKTSLKSSELSLHPEEPEELSALENHSELWMTTTADHLTFMNFQRLSRITCLASMMLR